MKQIIIILFLVIISIPAFSADVLKDVPKNHRARPALDDLLERGVDVTTGNPDGTYMGNKWTSKYDITYLVNALYLRMKKNGTAEVDVLDIKEEIGWLRSETAKLQETSEYQSDFIQHGAMEFRSKFGSVMAYEANKRAPLGPETNYRFIYSIEKELGNDARLKMNIDTMDGAFNSATQRGFPVKMLDVQGDLTANMGLDHPVKMKATVGPGSVQHRDTTGIVPSEDYTYFSRPRTTFNASTIMGGFDVGMGYAARGVAADGRVGTSELNMLIGGGAFEMPFIGRTRITSVSRYVFIDLMDPTAMPNDFHEEMTFLFDQDINYTHKLMLAASATDNPTNQFYLNYEFAGKDFIYKGAKFDLYFNSVGENYRLPFEALEFVPNNVFNRKILDNTIDIAIKLSFPLSSDLIIRKTTDWVGNSKWEMGRKAPGTSLTSELAIDKIISKNLTFTTYYRYYLVPSRIAQFSAVVPEVSDILGFSFMYKF